MKKKHKTRTDIKIHNLLNIEEKVVLFIIDATKVKEKCHFWI